MPELLEEQRENWGSRAGFVLAAIGSAVGLGNLWGFPYKVYDNGGGAFLIPYLIAMLLVGIPLLILEMSLGHMTQRAAPDAYRGINRKTEPVGWWGIILGFVIITYYPVILAYCGSYLVECVKGIFANAGEVAWKGEGLSGVEAHFNAYLNAWPKEQIQAGAVRAWSFGGLVNPIVISLVIIWLAMYFCIFRGVRLVSKVVLLTVPLPWIMLMILMVRGLTFEGATAGLNYYLDPDFSKLAQPETWRWAFGQMFFSMSLAFGVMITYASFLHRKSDINNNATIIGLADIGTSFGAGIAVFATLGAMAHASGGAARVENVVNGGPGLAFVAFPYALAQLPLSAWFGAVFFIALLTLGIDSAFSITESVLASIVDKTRWNRGAVLVLMSLLGLGLGLVYCTRGGLEWLGAIDEFINSTWGGIALLGLLECVVVGWAYRIKRLRDHANERSDWKLGAWWDLTIRYAAPLVLGALFSWSLLDKITGGEFLTQEIDGKEVLVVPVLAGLIVAVLAPVLAVVLSCIRSPGADRYAQHLDQPRTERAVGAIGTLLALATAGGLGWGGYLVGKARYASPVAAPGSSMASLDFYEPMSRMVLLATLAAGVLAVILGASVVARAERRRLRPSGLGRFAAGFGVMGVGAAAGILLGLTLYVNQGRAAARADETPPATAQAVETGVQPATAEAEVPATQTSTTRSDDRAGEPSLSGWSWLVLGLMLMILIVGLGWCFYRAIKAAGAGAEEAQLPEDGEA